MGKKAAAGRQGSAGKVVLSEEDAAQITSHKEEGTKLFGRKEYAKALDSYEKALKLLPEGHSDKALLHSNKAACHMMLKRYKESVNDCSAALEAQPNFFKALCRRAKAYEQLGLYKQALSDIQKANKCEQASSDTQESERRLKDILAGKRPAGMSNGLGKKAGKSGRPPMLFVQAKCTFEGETRLIHMTNNVTYAELLEAVHGKFPGCGHVLLKYCDREGDLVTITEKTDIQKGMAELVEQSGLGGPHGPKLTSPGMLPPMKISVVRAKGPEEVPPPPEEEARALAQLKAASAALQKQQAAKKQQQQQKQQKDEGEVYELDEWLVEFAQLFREQLGVDPDRHIELHNLGYEKCSAALEAAVGSEAALPLFDKAAERFQEVTANGLLNWGNVFMCVARKYCDEAAAAGAPASSVADKAEAELAKAEQRYNESLSYKPDYYDSFIALGQLFSERAKLLAGFIFVQPKPDLEAAGGDAKAAEAAALEAQLAATRAALGKLQAADVAKADAWFDKALDMFRKAMDSLPAEEGGKDAPPKEGEGGKDAPPKEGEDEVSLRAHTLVLWGNLLYEISQVRGAVGAPWKPLLDEAVAKFTEAGCSAADIRGALGNHSKRDEIEMPPEPEPEKAAPPAGEEESVKGLPALPKKPSGGKKASA